MDEEILTTDLVDTDTTSSVELMECDQSSTFIVTTTDEGDLVNLTQTLSSVPNAQSEGESYVIISTNENGVMNQGFFGNELLQEVVLTSVGILPTVQTSAPEQCSETLPSENGSLLNDVHSGGHNQFISISNLVTEFEEVESHEGATRSETSRFRNSPGKRKLSKKIAHNKPVNYVTPVQIPNGLLLFISESTDKSGGGQVVAMATKSDSLRKSGSQTVKKILPASREPNTFTTQTKSLRCPEKETVNTLDSAKSLKKKNWLPKCIKSSNDVCFLSKNAIRSVPLMDTNCTVTAYACELCEANNKSVQFCEFSRLSRHYRKTHQKQLARKASVACKEEGCNFKSWKVDQFRHHLSSVHGYEMKIHKVVFSSMEEFQEWKENEERQTGNQYVRSSGNHPARQGDCTYTYYICRRSGHYKDTTATTKKRLKSGAKINGRCTSTITLTQFHDNQTIHCEYWPFHYGHDNETSQRTLSKQEKKWILQLIQRGWNTDEILKALRDATITGTTERMRKTVRQDLANIVRSQGCRSFERRDADDAASVMLWLQELQSKGAVLISQSPAGAHSKTTLAEGHFLLMVMDEQQAELSRHADNHILQILHVPVPLTKSYQLVCLTTISKTEPQGYLLAYVLTDRYGPDTLRSILTAFQTKTGGVQPRLILSEDPAVVSLIWPAAHVSDIVEETTTAIPALIPWWKVDREWDESAKKWIRNENQRYAVKKFLKLLLSESDPDKFAAILQFVTVMLRSDAELSQFAQYFADKWTNQVENWAKLHPFPSDCTALIQLETEVNLIAQRARHVKRLDKCIYTLDYISRHQPFDPTVEFRADSSAEDSSKPQEVDALRSKICDDLKHLGQSIRSVGNAPALRQISRTIAETALAATNADPKSNAQLSDR